MQQTIKLFKIHKTLNKVLLKQIRYFLKQIRYPIRHIAITNCPFRFAFSHLPKCGQLLRQKGRKKLYMKFVCKVFLDFPVQTSQANLYRYFTNWLSLLESVNLRKTCSKLHVRLPLRSKLPTYFDDVTTIDMTSRQWASVREH